jgi:acetoin:2,6-dichlorophenolindophenol oxidoreductase subunit alpha
VSAETRALPESELKRCYESMVRIRVFEDIAQRLFLANEIDGSIHLYQGEEAVAVGVCTALEPDDAVAATYRGHGVLLARGSDPARLFAELLGRETGLCGGRAGSMNVVDLQHGVIGCFGIVGGSIAAATGAALASQLREDDTIAVAFFGDGAVNQAYFHECLNFAGVRRLPAVYVCANNQYGEFTPYASVTAGGRIAPRAAAYGLPGVEVDGNDVHAVRAAAEEAVDLARVGGGPTLLECHTYRHKGHSRHDDPRRYRPDDEFAAWLGRDPLVLTEHALDAEWARATRARVEAELDATLSEARSGPLPDPSRPVSATKESMWAS